MTAALSSGVATVLAPWLLRMLGGLLRIQVRGRGPGRVSPEKLFDFLNFEFVGAEAAAA